MASVVCHFVTICFGGRPRRRFGLVAIATGAAVFANFANSLRNTGIRKKGVIQVTARHRPSSDIATTVREMAPCRRRSKSCLRLLLLHMLNWMSQPVRY